MDDSVEWVGSKDVAWAVEAVEVGAADGLEGSEDWFRGAVESDRVVVRLCCRLMCCLWYGHDIREVKRNAKDSTGVDRMQEATLLDNRRMGAAAERKVDIAIGRYYKQWEMSSMRR
jgi:hypothetical protein